MKVKRWRRKNTSIWIKSFLANAFFSTCSSNSVDFDDDYVIDGDGDVGDTDYDE